MHERTRPNRSHRITQLIPRPQKTALTIINSDEFDEYSESDESLTIRHETGQPSQIDLTPLLNRVRKQLEIQQTERRTATICSSDSADRFGSIPRSAVLEH